MQTACWQLCFPIVLRELGTRHASPPRFNPVESVTPPLRSAGGIETVSGPDSFILALAGMPDDLRGQPLAYARLGTGRAEILPILYPFDTGAARGQAAL